MKERETSFTEFVLDAADHSHAFKPFAVYDRDGDCIEFIVKPDSFYAERIDSLVTVYYSHSTGEIIGSQIKGVSKFYEMLIKQIPGFQIEIEDGKVQLKHLFRARMWVEKEPQPILIKKYQKLVAVAEENEIETEFSFA